MTIISGDNISIITDNNQIVVEVNAAFNMVAGQTQGMNSYSWICQESGCMIEMEEILVAVGSQVMVMVSNLMCWTYPAP